ncbi:MAG: hypothetical protein ACLQGV_09400 [Bryobacteraceae bacterium]
MQSLFPPPLTDSAAPPLKRLRQERLFVHIAPRNVNRWPSFLASALLHLLFALLLPSLTLDLASPAEREASVRQERLLRTLRIRVPERLYLASTGALAQDRKPLAIPKLPPSTAAGKPSPGKDSHRHRSSGRQRRFELPPLPRHADSDQSIVQPNSSAELARDLRLPEVFFWSPPAAPQPVAEPYVLPGYAVPPSETRRLDAPPSLDLPSLGLVSPSTLQPLERAALAIPHSGMPIRTIFSDEPSQPPSASADSTPGEPTNLLSISSDPVPLREFLSIPPGSQVGRTPASGAEARDWSGGGANGGGAGGDQDARSGSAASASATASHPDSPASAAGKPDQPAQTASSSAAGAPPPGGSPARSAAVEATRMAHPAGGVFDVVVQSGGLEGFPESGGVLSGKPVYTVYLQVGAPTEWILQYCIPAEDAENYQINGSVVTLAAPPQLAAPFPLTTFRPPPHHRSGGYLMAHGFIGANGRFQDLGILGKGDASESAQAIAVLEQWEFRPASQNGAPVRVEILLAIPAE